MTKEEILQSVQITDLLAEYGIKVNRQGMCSCPFHKDRHPSMKVYPKTNSYHCFTCNETGDIFSLVQKMENCSFKDAFIRLGGEYKPTDKKARMMAKQSRERARANREKAERADKDLRWLICRCITIARLGTKIFEPYSEDWIYCTNSLTTFIHYLEEYEKGGINKINVFRKCERFRQFYNLMS